MGLLDDAIREHLELKRRHGADPEEVSRQEREALGAPVRGEFAKPAAADDDAELVEDDAAAVPASEETEIVEPPGQDAPDEPAQPEPEPGTEEDPWAVEDLADPDADREPAPEPPPEPEPPRERPAAVAAGAERPKSDEPDERGEDVLEETPEFLQETPEHERLWFEQKPPRDFDF
jgi:hypothetical protein